jgi:hypothetical protein
MHDRAALYWVTKLGAPFGAVADLIEQYLQELIAKGIWAMNDYAATRDAFFRSKWPSSHPSRSIEKTYGPGFGMLQPHLFREREIPQFTPYLRQVLGLPL